MNKIDARAYSRDELQKRRQDIIRMFMGKVPVMKIVELSGLSRPAVNAAIKKYETGGLAALEPAQRGRKHGTGRSLSEEQENEIRNILYRKRPLQTDIKNSGRKIRLNLWSRDAVMQLIQQQSEIVLSVGGVAKYLHRWGFPLLRRNQRPIKRCTLEIQGWLNDHLDQLTNTENADIYWVSKKILLIGNDEQGKRPQKLSMISAIDNHGKEHWLIVKGQFTQEKQILFLKTLMRAARKKVIMIRNNSEHFTERQVADWICENKSKIAVLPPLLPEEIEKKTARMRAQELRKNSKLSGIA